jgi:hypothetical protein
MIGHPINEFSPILRMHCGMSILWALPLALLQFVYRYNIVYVASFFLENFQKKKKKKLIACRVLGRAVGPLLAARALPLRCAASTMLSSTLLAI